MIADDFKSIAQGARQTDAELIAEANARAGDTFVYMKDLSLIARLTDALAAYQWQPIETAPRDGTFILLSSDRHSGNKVASWQEWQQGDTINGAWTDENQEGRMYDPTHWMPLPAPPETKP